MSNEIEFIPGLLAKAPHDKAPDFVKAGLSIKNAELVAYLQERIAQGEEWTNVDVKESKGGKWYAARNAYKPKEGGQDRSPAPSRGGGGSDGGSLYNVDENPDEIPFISNRGMW